MKKKFEINHTKIKGGCQSGRKVVTHNSKSDLPLSSDMLLVTFRKMFFTFFYPSRWAVIITQSSVLFIGGVQFFWRPGMQA